VYPPSAYATTDELIALARSMASRGGLYFSHIRGEGPTLLEAVAEAIRIGEEAGVPVQVAHIKAAGRESWAKLPRALALIDEARARAVDVTAGVYPYDAASTKLDSLLPAWMHDGGVARLMERLADPTTRRRVLGDCVLGDDRWHTEFGTVGWEEVVLAACRQADLAGRSLAEIAADAGRPAAETLLDLVRDEGAGATMILFSQSEENVARALAHPQVMVGSDALALVAGATPPRGKPHPRAYGTFPRVLGRYCRERRLLTWETAVHKMTGMPAAKLGLRDRGLVRVGAAADLALFDPATVLDPSTYAEPHQYPEGVPYVIVNGTVVVNDGRMQPAPAGRVLVPR
jgi:N-acyl-D-aspartate/D-glutamate deacylase